MEAEGMLQPVITQCPGGTEAGIGCEKPARRRPKRTGFGAELGAARRGERCPTRQKNRLSTILASPDSMRT